MSKWSRRFQKKCSSTGKNLSVLGPCVLEVAGTMRAGDDLTIRSREHNQVEISVAPKAKLEFGNNVFLTQSVRIACSMEVSIGDNALIGDEAVILDNDYHGVAGSAAKSAPVRIEQD